MLADQYDELFPGTAVIPPEAAEKALEYISVENSGELVDMRSGVKYSEDADNFWAIILRDAIAATQD